MLTSPVIVFLNRSYLPEKSQNDHKKTSRMLSSQNVSNINSQKTDRKLTACSLVTHVSFFSKSSDVSWHIKASTAL